MWDDVVKTDDFGISIDLKNYERDFKVQKIKMKLNNILVGMHSPERLVKVSWFTFFNTFI